MARRIRGTAAGGDVGEGGLVAGAGHCSCKTVEDLLERSDRLYCAAMLINRLQTVVRTFSSFVQLQVSCMGNMIWQSWLCGYWSLSWTCFQR